MFSHVLPERVPCEFNSVTKMVSVEGILKKAAEDESKSIQLVSVDKQVDLSLDLAHLAAFDTNPIDVKAFR